MKKIFPLSIFFLCGFLFGSQQFLPDLKRNPNTTELGEIQHLIGIMVEFQEESPDDPTTSGNGKFLSANSLSNAEDRCAGFLVDRPLHNTAYFEDQMQAVRNYYHNVSNGMIDFDFEIIDSIFQVEGYMAEYAGSDTELGQLFIEAVNLAHSELETIFDENSNSLIVLFHAGIGQDFAVPGLDPTPFDLSSAYIDEVMLEGLEIPEINGVTVDYGILLPETQNHIYFDVIEDIFYGADDYCAYQVGMTGTFALLMGYALGLPPLFNTENGDAGVGIFGLMDHGSNNGRGVIPALPTAWTRISKGWAESQTLTNDEYYQIFSNGFIAENESTDQIFRIDIAENEYFLIENRNNYIINNTDITELRNIRDEQNIVIETLHYFDVLTDSLSTGQIEIDVQTGVIKSFDNYDYGLPNSGLLIWHITEPDPTDLMSGINNDRDHRAVHLEEADGAIDIGFENYNMFVDPTTGWEWDMWFAYNSGYFFANSSEELNNEDRLLRFDNHTTPNTRSNSGAESFVSIENISSAGDTMYFNFNRTSDLNIIELGSDSLKVVGNSYSESDRTAYIYFIENNFLYKVGNDSRDSIAVANDQILVLSNPECEPDTVIISSDFSDSCWLDSNCELICDAPFHPIGWIDSISDFSTAPDALALGDIDQDGLDEIITIDDGALYIKNNNGTLSNGFPVYGSFYGVPLIANIMGDQQPEIICRDGHDIVILSADGQRERTIAAIDFLQPLSIIPFWTDSTSALVDGHRLLQFPLDYTHCYWLNPHSRPSNYPLVTGEHVIPTNQISGIESGKAYNYPNPIMEGETTFRYFVGNNVSKVDILIYDAAGYKIVKLSNSDITANEYNETVWDASIYDSGLYFAEIKPDKGDSHLVKVVLMR